MYYCYPVQETKLQAKGQETVKMIRRSRICISVFIVYKSLTVVCTIRTFIIIGSFETDKKLLQSNALN